MAGHKHCNQPSLVLTDKATVTARDFRGLRKLREAASERFVGGVVLYDGETTAGFGDRLYAVPIQALWQLA